MPTYDFRCNICGEEREEFISLEEHGKKDVLCKCGVPMVQVFTVGNFKVKGGTPSFSFRPRSTMKPKSYVPDRPKRVQE